MNDEFVSNMHQVDPQGKSWRSGAKVEKRPLRQWYLKTTAFAKDLYEGLDDPTLKDWRDIVKIQKNWIGKPDGVKFDFQIQDERRQKLSVWTDKPELIEHTSFILVTNDHLLANMDLAVDEGKNLVDLEFYF